MTRKQCKVKFFKAPKKEKPSSYFIIGIKATASGIQTIWRIQKIQIFCKAQHVHACHVLICPNEAQKLASLMHSPRAQTTKLITAKMPNYNSKLEDLSSNFIHDKGTECLGCLWAAAQGQQSALGQMNFGQAAHQHQGDQGRKLSRHLHKR